MLLKGAVKQITTFYTEGYLPSLCLHLNGCTFGGSVHPHLSEQIPLAMPLKPFGPSSSGS